LAAALWPMASHRGASGRLRRLCEHKLLSCPTASYFAQVAEVAVGSKSEELRVSISSPRCPQEQTSLSRSLRPETRLRRIYSDTAILPTAN
jgi:hypothetical protein